MDVEDGSVMAETFVRRLVEEHNGARAEEYANL
jgi:Flp pilus assembly pilin Flp